MSVTFFGGVIPKSQEFGAISSGASKAKNFVRECSPIEMVESSCLAVRGGMDMDCNIYLLYGRRAVYRNGSYYLMFGSFFHEFPFF